MINDSVFNEQFFVVFWSLTFIWLIYVGTALANLHADMLSFLKTGKKKYYNAPWHTNILFYFDGLIKNLLSNMVTYLVELLLFLAK